MSTVTHMETVRHVEVMSEQFELPGYWECVLGLVMYVMSNNNA